MKALIVSDSHGRFGCIQDVIEREQPMDILLHAGDAQGNMERLAEFAGCPIFTARGNCDFYSDVPYEQIVPFGSHRIFLSHGHQYRIKLSVSEIAEAARQEGADIVVCGHTHKPLIEERYGVLVLNPGSISEPRQENRRPTYLVLKTEAMGKLSWEVKYV